MAWFDDPLASPPPPVDSAGQPPWTPSVVEPEPSVPWPPPEWTGSLPSEVPQPEPTTRERVEAVDAGAPIPKPTQPWAPAEWGVDALSGGAPPPVPPPEAPGEFSLPSSDLVVPEGLADDYEAQQQEKFAALSPEDKAGVVAKFTQQRDQELADSLAEKQRADQATADRNQVIQDNAYGQLLVDRHFMKQEQARLAKQHEDPDRWLKNLSTGQNVAMFVGAAINGFLNPGGDNPTIKLALHEIDKDIDSQRQNMAMQRQDLADRMGAATEDYQLAHQQFLQAEAKRQAAYAKVDEQLAVEQAKYDPAGTRFLAIAGERQAAAAHAAQARAKAEKEAIDRNIKAGEFEIKAQEALDKHAKFKKDMAPKSAGPRYTAADIQKLYPGLVVPDKPGGWSQKDIQGLVGVRKDVADLTGGGPKATEQATKDLDLEQKERADVVKDPFTQEAIGKPIDAEPAARKGSRDKIEAYGNLRTEYGRLIDYINKAPREPKLFDRWKSENRTKVETMRKQVASTYAKAVDPVGAVSDKSEAAAMGVLPDIDGWTEKKNPLAVYDVIIKTADDRIENHAKGAIEGYKPGTLTKHYQDYDKILLAPPPKPLEQPNQGGGMETFEDAEGKQHHVVPTVGDPIDA